MSYSTSGTIAVSSDDLTDEEVVTSIQNTLAEELNIHPSEVEVSFDPETGVVTYTITSDEADSLTNVIADMQSDVFEDALSSIEGIVVESYEAPEDVTATVDVIVDASNVDNVDTSVNAVTEALQEQDPNYDVVGEGKLPINF